MLEIVQRIETQTREGGSGGIKTGFPMFDSHTDGLQPGLIIIAGRPNQGKTAFACQMAWNMATGTDNKVYALYISIDDSLRDTVARVVALDRRIPIAAVKFPDRHPAYVRMREAGFQRLAHAVRAFKVLDQTSVQSIEALEEVVREHLLALELAREGRQLVLFVDSFHDLIVEKRGDLDRSQRYEVVASELERMAQVYSIPVICTAEVRKVNSNRRLIFEDVRETIKICYKAKLIGLIHNDVDCKGENSPMFWTDKNGRIRPVLEFHFAKNKLSSFKGRLFYRFIPEFSSVVEVTSEDNKRYLSKIME
ncbi:MAG: DnaB-like helicase C-terminal domain-containing protein [Bacillota bacterium]